MNLHLLVDKIIYTSSYHLADAYIVITDTVRN